jgi:hypothetical protein
MHTNVANSLRGWFAAHTMLLVVAMTASLLVRVR